MHEVRLSSVALRDLDAISPRYAAAIVEFMFGLLAENPRRVGKPPSRELSGTWSARRGDYRVLYRVDDATEAVLVIRVDHRSRVYRTR